MALIPVRLYGDAVLRKKARPVESPDILNTDLIYDMIDTMYRKDGVGLAAPQVGESIRLAVIDLSLGESYNQAIVVINPEIFDPEGEAVIEEGCLSIPGIKEDVVRSSKLRVRFKDLTWEDREMVCEGLLARVISHELDHLNGTLFVDRINSLKRKLLSAKLEEIAEDSSDPG